MGQRFQAEVPPTRNVLLMLYDEHLAQLVWAPWGDTSTNTDTQKRGEDGPSHPFFLTFTPDLTVRWCSADSPNF